MHCKPFIHQFQPKLIFLISIAAAFLVLTACKPADTVDKPASELDVTVQMQDIVENAPNDSVAVVMQFFVDGNQVKLEDNAVVSCNGVPLTGISQDYAGRVPQQPVGSAYTFQHSREGVNTTVAVTVPARPVFSPPTGEGAAIARTANLTIFYVPDNGKAVRGRASDGTFSVTNSQEDSGAHLGMDVSNFNSGPGTLSLVREYEEPLGGSGFHSVQKKYFSGKSIDITWQ